MCFVRDTSAAALIEFALTSVIFFTTIFAILGFGIGIWQYNMIANLAQEGARWASVRGTTTGGLGPASSSDVQTFVDGRALGMSVTVSTTPASNWTPGGTVAVTVQKTFTPFTSLLPATSWTLQSTAKMVVTR